jgi:hypothetical protein
MEMILGLGMFALVAIAFLYLLPIVLILFSSKTSGGEKLLWLVGIFFFSWFTWIAYMLVAPISNRSASS